MGRWQGHFKPPPKPYGDPRSLSRSQKEAGGPQVTAPGAAIQEVLKEGSGGAGDTRGGSAGSSFCAGRAELWSPPDRGFFTSAQDATQASLHSSAHSQVAAEHGFKTEDFFVNRLPFQSLDGFI